MNRKTAEAVLAEVRAKYAPFLAESGTGPTLYDHTHEEQSEGSWCIWWEEGPYEWALHFEAIGKDVFVEPIYSNCLGLYDA